MLNFVMHIEKILKRFAPYASLKDKSGFWQRFYWVFHLATSYQGITAPSAVVKLKFAKLNVAKNAVENQ